MCKLSNTPNTPQHLPIHMNNNLPPLTNLSSTSSTQFTELRRISASNDDEPFAAYQRRNESEVKISFNVNYSNE